MTEHAAAGVVPEWTLGDRLRKAREHTRMNQEQLATVVGTATAHALRHTFGTYVMRESRDIRVTQEAMRHKSIASTQVYTQVSSADLQRAVKALNWAAA